MDTTNKDSTKPAATSVATNASTPGAVRADVSSGVKGQQAFQKTKDLSDGPKHHAEDDEKLRAGPRSN